MNKFFTAALVAALCISSAFSNISFGGIDVTEENNLLYFIEHNIPGSPSYKTLFTTVLGEDRIISSPKPITCYPERIESLHDGRTLQVRNRYGTAWYSYSTKKLRWISFSNTIPSDFINTNAEAVSPDGNWTVFVQQTGNAVGRLVLMNTKTLEQQVLSETTEYKYDSLNAKWSPDSKTLLYEKMGAIYFTTPDALAKKNFSLPEDYRKIGNGNINCVNWTGDSTIIFIDNDIVYRVNSNELYTRGLYSSLVGSGTIIARLPNAFNRHYDTFFCNYDGSEIVLVAKNKIVYNYRLEKNLNFSYAKTVGIYSLTELRGSPLHYDVFWTSKHMPVLWLTLLSYGKSERVSGLYALENKLTLLEESRESINPSVSPDGKYLAYTNENYLCIYDLIHREPVSKLGNEKVVSTAWKNSRTLIVGGEDTVRIFNLADDRKPFSILFLSAAGNAYWDDDKIVSKIGLDAYIYDAEKNSWDNWSNISFRSTRREKNGSFRVFSSECSNSKFENALYVRSLSGGLTTYSVYPDTDFEIPQNKKVSLVFDAIDDAEGLGKILSILDSFNIKATFFINGEFIRRYPMETKQIALSGNECASGFYSTRNLVSSDFSIDEEFVRRGLARNEDEFFAATGKELSLSWHAPDYSDSIMIRNAGTEAGYRYVTPFLKFNDRITFEKCSENPKLHYMSSRELIDSFVENLYDGMIIPVTIGRNFGTRNDYLYENIDLLIAAILEKGYQICLN